MDSVKMKYNLDVFHATLQVADIIFDTLLQISDIILEAMSEKVWATAQIMCRTVQSGSSDGNCPSDWASQSTWDASSSVHA